MLASRSAPPIPIRAQFVPLSLVWTWVNLLVKSVARSRQAHCSMLRTELVVLRLSTAPLRELA